MSAMIEYAGVEEQVVLLDEDFREIGTLAKAEAHTGDTPLHLAFSLFLFDSKGRLLVQRRALSKTTWAGVWSNSCCGHPMPGEAMKDAVMRRTRYELGIELATAECILPDFRYRACWKGIWENELCPVWVGFIEETPADFERREVEEVNWVSWEAFARASERPEASAFSHFSPWSMMEARELRESRRFNDLMLEWRNDCSAVNCNLNSDMESLDDAV